MSETPHFPENHPMAAGDTDSHDVYANPQDHLDPIDELVRGVDLASIDDDAIEDLVDQHPLTRELTERLKSHRDNLSKEQEQAYVDNIRGMREEVGNQIREKLGLSIEDPEETAKQAELERLQKLGSILMGLTGVETEDELLSKYHLVDEEGRMTKQSMDSPLFKADTRSAFERYMRFAVQFDAMEQAERMSGIRLKNAVAASNMRGAAHNAVADFVSRDLGLPFDAARRFVAKAREARVPGLHERATYATLLQGEKLAARSGNDLAAFTREQLKGLIDRPMDHEKDSD